MAQAVAQDAAASLGTHQTDVEDASSRGPQGDSPAEITNKHLVVSENSPSSPASADSSTTELASATTSVAPTPSGGTLAGRCKLPEAKTVAKWFGGGTIAATVIGLTGAAQYGAIGGAVGAVLAGPVGWAVLGIAGLTVLGVAVWKSRLPERIALYKRVKASINMLTRDSGFSPEGTQQIVPAGTSLESYLTGRLWGAVDRRRRTARQNGIDPLRELSQDRVDQVAKALWDETETRVLRARIGSSIARTLHESDCDADGMKQVAVGSGLPPVEMDLADELWEHVDALRHAARLQGNAPLDELSEDRLDELAKTLWNRLNQPVPKIGDSTYLQRCHDSEKDAQEACHSAIDLLLRKDPEPTSQEYLDAFAAATFKSYHYTMTEGGEQGLAGADNFIEHLDKFIKTDCDERLTGDENKSHFEKLWREFPGFATLYLGLEGFTSRSDLPYQMTKGEVGRWVADIYSCVWIAFTHLGAEEQWAAGSSKLTANQRVTPFASSPRTGPKTSGPGSNVNGPAGPIVSPKELDRFTGKLAETVAMEMLARQTGAVENTWDSQQPRPSLHVDESN